MPGPSVHADRRERRRLPPRHGPPRRAPIAPRPARPVHSWPQRPALALRPPPLRARERRSCPSDALCHPASGRPRRRHLATPCSHSTPACPWRRRVRGVRRCPTPSGPRWTRDRRTPRGSSAGSRGRRRHPDSDQIGPKRSTPCPRSCRHWSVPTRTAVVGSRRLRLGCVRRQCLRPDVGRSPGHPRQAPIPNPRSAARIPSPGAAHRCRSPSTVRNRLWSRLISRPRERAPNGHSASRFRTHPCPTRTSAAFPPSRPSRRRPGAPYVPGQGAMNSKTTEGP